jgi:predicted transcriptional regulator
MVKQKRDRLDLIYDILQNIRKSNDNLGPTNLQNKSNLSSKMFKEYISELEQTDLIKKIEIPKSKKYIFSLTKKGNQFLDKYKEMKQFVESFGL